MASSDGTNARGEPPALEGSGGSDLSASHLEVRGMASMEVAGPPAAAAPDSGPEPGPVPDPGSAGAGGEEPAQLPPTAAQKVWRRLAGAWWVVDGFLAELFGLNAHRYDYEMRQAVLQHEEYRRELKKAEERRAARERRAAEAAEGGQAGPSGARGGAGPSGGVAGGGP